MNIYKLFKEGMIKNELSRKINKIASPISFSTSFVLLKFIKAKTKAKISIRLPPTFDCKESEKVVIETSGAKSLKELLDKGKK